VQEFFCSWDVQAVEAAVAVGVAVCVEGGADLCLGESADFDHWEGREVDGYLFVRECDVAGDGLGGVAGCSPGASFLSSEGQADEQ
jgi:hypothetical protein